MASENREQMNVYEDNINEPDKKPSTSRDPQKRQKLVASLKARAHCNPSQARHRRPTRQQVHNCAACSRALTLSIAANVCVSRALQPEPDTETLVEELARIQRSDPREIEQSELDSLHEQAKDLHMKKLRIGIDEETKANNMVHAFNNMVHALVDQMKVTRKAGAAASVTARTRAAQTRSTGCAQELAPASASLTHTGRHRIAC